MTTSRFQNLRVALQTQIVARLATDATTGVTVSAYPPLGDYAKVDRVWIGEIRGRQEPYTYSGTGSRMETLEVDLRVYAPTYGGSADEQLEAESRAELIFASVENTLRADITVSSTVYNVELDSFTSQVGMIDDQGPAGYIEAVILAEAHI